MPHDENHAPEAPDTTPSPAGVEEMARAAVKGLAELAENRRRQAEATFRLISALRMDLRNAREETAEARRETKAALEEAGRMKRINGILGENQKRLHAGFITLVKSIEDTCAGGVAVDQRIEAMLLSADTGNVLGVSSDVTTTRARDFLAAAEPHTASKEI